MIAYATEAEHITEDEYTTEDLLKIATWQVSNDEG